jgi:PAS domain S-box-containing protein
VRPRQIAPVSLVLVLTVAGFVVARLLAERDARRDSERSAEVAAAAAPAPPSTGTSGLVLVAPAPNLISEALASQRLQLVVPREPVGGPAAVLPWIILAAGLVLAGLAAARGASAAQRDEAQAELDRVFRLSNDLIAVADFDGWFTRVNAAAEEIQGYTEQDLLERPYGDFVHPDDRERTASETAALGQGKTTLGFENRSIRKDGQHRVHRAGLQGGRRLPLEPTRLRWT